MRRKHALGVLAGMAVLVFGVAVSASSGKSDAKPPIRFALITFQIPGSDLLSEFKAGADAAAKIINAKGGFGGRKVVIDGCNSQLQPAAATACAHTTLAKHPVAMFGCELAWSAAGLGIYASADVPTFNCPNTTEDFNNPWSFAIVAGQVGDLHAGARYLCGRADVKNVVAFVPDLPSMHAITEPSAGPILAKCGKSISYIYYPLTATDVTPYVQQLVNAKPDFVLFSGIGGQVVQVFKAFQQAGFPASKVIAPDTDFVYQTILKQAGNTMDGAYSENVHASWSDTSNPDVVAYLKAMKGAGVDPRDPTVEWGYADIAWFYTVAKAVGFSKFNGKTLAKFMNTQHRVHMPLSRSLFNPGPKGYPQVRQPYVQISQWKNGKLGVVTKGTNQGWVYAF
jgi:ABC-type branched-subunit amino acid transport system substrate-binding protein